MFSFASLTGGKAPARAPSPTPTASAAPAVAPKTAPKPMLAPPSSSSSAVAAPSATPLSTTAVAAVAPVSADKETIEKLEYKIELLSHINILSSNEREMLEKRLQMLQYYLVNKTELYDVIKDAKMYGSGDNKLNYNINDFSEFLTKFKDNFTSNPLMYLNAFTDNGSIVYTLEYSAFISKIQSLSKEYKYIDVEMLYYKFYNGKDVVIADLIDFFLTSDEFKKAKAIISILKHSKKDIIQNIPMASETNPFEEKPPLATTTIMKTTSDGSDGSTIPTPTNPFDSSPPPMPDKPVRRKLGGISGRRSPSPAPADNGVSVATELDDKPTPAPTPATAPVVISPTPEPAAEIPVSSPTPADVLATNVQKKESEKKKQPLISDHMSSYFDQLGLGKKPIATPAEPAPAPIGVVPPPKPAKRGFF